MKEKLIVTKPQERCGVYAIVNVIEKKAYVGESKDLCQRLSDHIRNILFELEDNGTNNNLIRDARDNGKAFEIFPVLFAQNYDKGKADLQRNHDWIVDETVYMYLFRKHGFTLYNGEDDLKVRDKKRDNVGKERSFLLDNKITGEQLEKELNAFLDKESMPYSISEAQQELNKDLYERFAKTLDELGELSKKEREAVWDKRISDLTKEQSELHNKGMLYVIDPKMSKGKLRTVCNELLKERLKKEDMEACGVHGKTMEELIQLVEDQKLNRIGICKFGHYLDQSPMTILMTKVYDIQHNKMIWDESDIEITLKEEKQAEEGICFWAFKGLKDKAARAYLSREDKSPRYVIMPYTTSDLYKSSQKGNSELQKKMESDLNPHDNEGLEVFFERMRTSYEERKQIIKEKLQRDDFLDERMELDKFSFGYALNKGGRPKHPYPEGMFPEVIAKWSVSENGNIRNSHSVAFLISQLCYVDAEIGQEELFRFYKSHTGNSVENTIKGINSKCCAQLQQKEELLKLLKNASGKPLDDREEVKLLIAKIEYPYVVALENEPILLDKYSEVF